MAKAKRLENVEHLRQRVLQLLQETVLGTSLHYMTKSTPMEMRIEYFPGRTWTIKKWTDGDKEEFMLRWKDKINPDKGIPDDLKDNRQFAREAVYYSIKNGPIKLNAIEDVRGLAQDEAQCLMDNVFLYNLRVTGTERLLSEVSKLASQLNFPKAPMITKPPAS